MSDRNQEALPNFHKLFSHMKIIFEIFEKRKISNSLQCSYFYDIHTLNHTLYMFSTKSKLILKLKTLTKYSLNKYFQTNSLKIVHFKLNVLKSLYIFLEDTLQMSDRQNKLPQMQLK